MVKKQSSKKLSSRLDSKSKKKSMKIKQLKVKKILTDNEVKELEGKLLTQKYFPHIIDENCDVYYLDKGKKITLARFRKKVIPLKLCQIALEELEEASKKKHDNRGAAGGELNLDLLPKYVNRDMMVKRSKYVIRGYQSLKNGNMVSQIIGNPVSSNIIGFYDKPDRNLGKGAPQCRLTQFNKNNMLKFKKVTPFLQSINQQFKNLMPSQYKKQLARARKTNFVIDKTAFSTVTINHNWRTAVHCDSGDYKEGFGNLVVCEKGKYQGGYTGFPQFGVAFNVRQGDFLAMDVHQWHGNTKLKGNPDKFTRMSVVCYLREKMVRCEGLEVEEPSEF